jgi:putative phosphoesterase
MTHATYAIRGNHDHGVAQGIPVNGATGFRYLTKISRPSMWDALGLEERRYLLQLPVTQRVTLGGMRYLLVHATPRDPLDEYLLKDPETWAKRLQNVDADVVCVGHTHVQFNIQVNGVVVLNPGSVGLPRDGDPRAGYAIIDDNKIEMKRVTYPIEETTARIDAMPWPRRGKDIMSYVLRNGRLPAQLDQGGPRSAADDDPDDE